MARKDEIQQEINDQLILTENKTEGTFGQDVIGAVSYGIARLEEFRIEPLLDRAFATTAVGDDLDRVGADELLPRKQATSSTIKVTITGKNGSSVNPSVKLVYKDLQFSTTQNHIIDENLNVDVDFTCDYAGISGNLPEGTVFDFAQKYIGLDKAVAKEQGINGFDIEADAEYRERILFKKAEEGSSGNEAHYKMWAEEVAGVGRALIVSLEFGNGTVGVHIATVDKTTPTNELLDAVRSNINVKKPIGATVTVLSVEYIDIKINANIKIDSTTNISIVKDLFNKNLKEYLNTTSDVVSYLKISDLFFNIEGVSDVLDYTLNGSKVSLPLSGFQIARAGELNINA